MASASAVRPEAKPSALDETGVFFWNFLRNELTPYPGRLWVVGRVTIAAAIVMLITMTFQIPAGFLGAIFTFFLSRENPVATFRSGANSILGFFMATVYSVISLQLLVDDPLTHFLWVILSLFLSFWFLRILADAGMGVAFGFMVSGAISVWDANTVSVNTRLTNTLWQGGVVAMGIVVSIVVEFVFRRVHPATDLNEGIEERLKTVETVLRSAANAEPLDSAIDKLLSLYASVGTSRLRRLIQRSEASVHFKAQMNAAVALVGRLVDITASFRLTLTEHPRAIGSSDRGRLILLADRVAQVERALALRQVPRKIPRPLQDEASDLPFLPTLERTLALIPDAFAGSQSVQQFVLSPLDEESPGTPFFTRDAFTNRDHLLFALRGTLAAVACYTVYHSIDWTGLSTSVPTCFITALSTIGSSRQKQILRLGGAIVGGIVFGMGAQIFVLPYLDSIFGFTILFCVVTAISSWIGTASARLSYLGVQLALAWYVINLQEFTIQTSLSVARDRVFGVMLGLLSMWLFFDRLWTRNALDEMQRLFTRNLEMLAELAEQLLEPDQVKAIRRMRVLRDQLNAGFEAVRAQSDAVLFEFGPSRARKMQIRDDVKRWQPQVRTLLLVQITAIQYLTQKPLSELPEPVAAAGVSFERDAARVMRAMSQEVSGDAVDAVPDIRDCSLRVKREIEEYYRGLAVPVPAQATDVIGLTESLASILGPLFEDVRDTFAAQQHVVLAQGSLSPLN